MFKVGDRVRVKQNVFRRIVIGILLVSLLPFVTMCSEKTVVIKEETVMPPVEEAIKADFDPVCEGFRYTAMRRNRSTTCINSYHVTTGLLFARIHGYVNSEVMLAWLATDKKPVTIIHRNGTVAVYP